MRDKKEIMKDNQIDIVREVDQENYKKKKINKKKINIIKKNQVHLHHHLFLVRDHRKNNHLNLDF
jgi:hypothetical protein